MVGNCLNQDFQDSKNREHKGNPPITFFLIVNEIVACLPAISIDRNNTADFTAFYNGFLNEQIGDGSAVLVGKVFDNLWHFWRFWRFLAVFFTKLQDRV